MHFEIQADDVERAKKFYESALGWKIEKYESGDNPDMMEYWMIMTGKDGTPGINGGIYKRDPKEKIYTYDCTIMVDDIDKAIKAIKMNGGKIRTEKTGQEKNELKGVGWFAGAVDTEGNRFAIMQPTDWQPK